MKTINVMKLHKNATLPTRAHEGDAGLDIYALEDVGYDPRDTIVVVPTGVAMSVESGYVGLIKDRSSVSKTGLKVTAGVIDAGYTGEVNIVFLNHSKEAGCFRKGSKIAQMVVQKVELPTVTEVTTLAKSERGSKGFGSTGV
jgi:dUTP pyrophosphatase